MFSLAIDPADGLSWLLNAAAAVSVLVVAGGAGGWLLRRGSAASRHVVWVGVLSAAVLVPAISLAVPWRWDAAEYRPPVELVRARATESVVRPVAVLPQAVPRPRSVDVGTVVLVLWVAGAFAVLTRVGVGSLALARMARRASFVGDPRVERLARRAGLNGPVRVGQVDGLKVPVTAGVFRPVVLVPAGSLEEWSSNRLAAVLLHEFAHVARRDVAAHLLGRLACALHWFNPLVWWAAKRATRESERACDDAVLRSGARPSAYASHVLEIARAAAGWRVPLPAVGQGSELEGRLLAVLAADARRSPVPRRAVALASITIAALSVAAATHAGIASAGEPPAEAAPAVAEPRTPGEREALLSELVRLLEDDHAPVRSAAARSLGEMRAEIAVPALAAALRDPVDYVREHAALALGEIESPAAVPALAAVLASDGDREVREAAARALGETESAAAAEALARALAAEASPRMRVHLVQALGETHQDAAVPSLGAALNDADERVRRAALDGLSAIGSPAAAELLIQALRSEDAHVRRSAARALGEEARD